MAQEIIDDVFLPAFGRAEFDVGIEAGTSVVADRIAREHAAGNPPAEVANGDGDAADLGLGALVVAVFGAVALFGRRVADKFRRCPSCGARGIHTARETLERATRTSTGRGRKTITCPHCGHEESSTYTISRIRSSSSSGGGSFGGGSSSGGGASGRW